MREAYEAKKWAFVSDYARLDIVYSHGGIYLDLDVELLKPLDELLTASCFFGTEHSKLINSGLGFGSEKGNNILKKMLEEYENISFKIKDNIYDMTPCPERNTIPFTILGFKFSETDIWEFKGIKVFPPRFFCPLNYDTHECVITNNTYSIHLYNASWLTIEEQEKFKKIEKIKEQHGKISSFFLVQSLKYTYEKNEISFLNFVKKEIKRKIMLNKTRHNL